MDDLDHEIVRLMKEERMTITEVANELHRCRGTIVYRVQRMQQSGFEPPQDDLDARIIRSMANNRMMITRVARELYCHRNTVLYRIQRMKEKRGIDLLNVRDLVKAWTNWMQRRNVMREIWKPVPGTDGWYDVSTHGQVRSWVGCGWRERYRAKEPRLLKCSLTSQNGLVVTLGQKRFTVKKYRAGCIHGR